MAVWVAAAALKAITVCGLAVGATGCCDVALDQAAKAQVAAEDADRARRHAELQLAAAHRENEDLRGRLAALDPEPARQLRRQHLVAPAAIRLGRLTGGRDTDNRPGHDALRVYVEVLDAAGDAIKQGGAAEIDLYDLNGTVPRKVARWVFDAPATAAAWSALLGQYGYRFDCPWTASDPPPQPQPAGPLTVRVIFRELLGGRVLIAEMPLEILGWPPTPPQPQERQAATTPVR